MATPDTYGAVAPPHTVQPYVPRSRKRTKAGERVSMNVGVLCSFGHATISLPEASIGGLAWATRCGICLLYCMWTMMHMVQAGSRLADSVTTGVAASCRDVTLRRKLFRAFRSAGCSIYLISILIFVLIPQRALLCVSLRYHSA